MKEDSFIFLIPRCAASSLMHRCLALFLIAVPLFGQTSSHSASRSISDDLSLYTHLSLHTFSSPFRWQGSDWIVAGGIAGATVASSSLDNDVLNLMERNRTSGNDRLQSIAVEYGAGLNVILLTGAMYGSGLLFENDWLRTTSVLLASALTVTATTGTVLKVVVGRARPYVGEGHGAFTPFTLKSGFNSFPSGHTIAAFTLSAVLSERIKNIWASIALYGAATLCGVSRLYSNDHWLSDCVFGGAFATCAAKSVVGWYENGMRDDENPTGFHIIPQSNGVQFVWRF